MQVILSFSKTLKEDANSNSTIKNVLYMPSDNFDEIKVPIVLKCSVELNGLGINEGKIKQKCFCWI